MGDQEVPGDQIATRLDEVLSSSLWERRLGRRTEELQQVYQSALHGRAKFLWSNSRRRSSFDTFRLVAVRVAGHARRSGRYRHQPQGRPGPDSECANVPGNEAEPHGGELRQAAGAGAEVQNKPVLVGFKKRLVSGQQAFLHPDHRRSRQREKHGQYLA